MIAVSPVHAGPPGLKGLTQILPNPEILKILIQTTDCNLV